MEIFERHERISRNILSGAPEEVRKANCEGQTPLLIACKQGRLELTKWLFDNGAAEDVRVADSNGWTPMFWACENVHLEVAQRLFGAGAAEDVRTPDEDGRAPMFWACCKGHLEVAQWLFSAGAAEDVRTADEDGSSPMFWACSNGHLEVAKWLFGAGAAEDVRTADRGGRTPMLFACRNGHLEVALWLICNGAATNTSTGLIAASIMQNRAVNNIATKLRSAINVHITNQSNFTTLILPAICKFPRVPLQEDPLASLERALRVSPGSCHLAQLCGLESSVVVLIADFAGVVRGRQLRHLREACAFL